MTGVSSSSSGDGVHLVTGVLALNTRGELLLVSGPKFPDWVIPGGHVEKGERLEDCARRELLEETGLQCDKMEFLGLNEDLDRRIRGVSKHFVFVNFWCRAGEQVKLDEKELTKFVWIPLEKASRDKGVADTVRAAARLLLEKISGEAEKLEAQELKKEKDHARAIVGTYVLNGGGELLLVKSPKWKKDYWIVPGGHVELGESIAKAAVRETLEETGVLGKFEAVFAVFESIFDPDFGLKRHLVFIECLLHSKGRPEVKLDGEELADFVWIPPEKCLKKNLEPNTRKGIEALVKFLEKREFTSGI